MFFIKSKKIIISLMVFLFAFFAVMPVWAIDTGLESTLGSVDAKNQQALAHNNDDLSEIIGSIIGNLLAFVGLIFFVLIIYAGFQWMTAGGNEEDVKKAIGLITQAVFGLIIISAAYLITRFVGESVIGK